MHGASTSAAAAAAAAHRGESSRHRNGRVFTPLICWRSVCVHGSSRHTPARKSSGHLDETAVSFPFVSKTSAWLEEESAFRSEHAAEHDSVTTRFHRYHGPSCCCKSEKN
ncbi:hypothetical protein JOB18_037240 [Solea senegalensis]|uniref:Secreted protein n=1 Tax=Solea senegalensis TaxID=28829 RepID=A0AAV6SVU1_SOLSE|nr:hypothetical protein JOB18_037240 [Solea senegalensis]